MGYLNVDYISETETTAMRTFEQALRWHSERLDRYIDTLLALCHHVRAESSTPDDWFPFIAWERFQLAPYSLRAATLLLKRGYTAESYTLLRHVVEVFAQLRYFATHRDVLKQHLSATKAKDRVPFKVMFEALSPGYYVKYYSIASGVAHAGLHLSIASGMTRDETEMKLHPPYGCTFDEKKASLSINQAFLLMLGFLTQVTSWFPDYLSSVLKADPSVEVSRMNAIVELREWLGGHRLAHPQSAEWIEKSTALLGVTL